MNEPREAFTVQGLPDADGDSAYYRVGSSYGQVVDNTYKTVGVVSRIVIEADLPGLHYSLERVKVYDGDTMIFEIPVHNCGGITYKGPNT